MKTEHKIAMEQIKAATTNADVAVELIKYIPIAQMTAKALKAERKLMNDLSDKGLKYLVKGFDMDSEAAGTEYALKMALRSFRSNTII